MTRIIKVLLYVSIFFAFKSNALSCIKVDDLDLDYMRSLTWLDGIPLFYGLSHLYTVDGGELVDLASYSYSSDVEVLNNIHIPLLSIDGEGLFKIKGRELELFLKLEENEGIDETIPIDEKNSIIATTAGYYLVYGSEVSNLLDRISILGLKPPFRIDDAHVINGNVLLIVNGYLLYITTNNGLEIRKISSDADEIIRANEKETFVTMVNDSKVLYFSDYWKSFELPETYSKIYALGDGYILIRGDSGYFYLSKNGDTKKLDIFNEDYGFVTGIWHLNDDQTLFQLWDDSLYMRNKREIKKNFDHQLFGRNIAHVHKLDKEILLEWNNKNWRLKGGSFIEEKRFPAKIMGVYVLEDGSRAVVSHQIMTGEFHINRILDGKIIDHKKFGSSSINTNKIFTKGFDGFSSSNKYSSFDIFASAYHSVLEFTGAPIFIGEFGVIKYDTDGLTSLFEASGKWDGIGSGNITQVGKNDEYLALEISGDLYLFDGLDVKLVSNYEETGRLHNLRRISETFLSAGSYIFIQDKLSINKVEIDSHTLRKLVELSENLEFERLLKLEYPAKIFHDIPAATSKTNTLQGLINQPIAMSWTLNSNCVEHYKPALFRAVIIHEESTSAFDVNYTSSNGQLNKDHLRLDRVFENPGDYKLHLEVYEQGRWKKISSITNVNIRAAPHEYFLELLHDIAGWLLVAHFMLYGVFIFLSRWSQFFWDIIMSKNFGRIGIYYNFALRHSKLLQLWVFDRWYMQVKKSVVRKAYLPLTITFNQGEHECGAVDLYSLMLERGPLWLQGNPGMGKSSTFDAMKYEFFNYSSIFRAYDKHSSIPVFIKLREFIYFDPRGKDYSEWVEDLVARALSDEGMDIHDRLLIRNMIRMKVLSLLFDGGNEFPYTGHIESYARRKGTAPLLITSQAEPQYEFEILRLPRDISNYIEGLLRLNFEPPIACEISSRLETEGLLKYLVSGHDIMLLIELIKIGMDYDNLPRSRYELYDLFLQSSLNGIKSHHMHDLYEMAAELWVNKVREFNEEKINSSLHTRLLNSKLLNQHKNNRFEFRHDEMQAFLVSKYLKQCVNDLVGYLSENESIWKLGKFDQEQVWKFLVMQIDDRYAYKLWVWSTRDASRIFLQQQLQKTKLVKKMIEG